MDALPQPIPPVTQCGGQAPDRDQQAGTSVENFLGSVVLDLGDYKKAGSDDGPA